MVDRNPLCFSKMFFYEQFMSDRFTPTKSGAFEAGPWLRRLPPDLIATLKAAADVRKVPRGVRLREIGDTAEHLIGVESGVIALHTDDEEQQDVIGHVFWPGDWLGVAALLLDVPIALGGSALIDSSVVFLHRSQIEKIAARQPQVWRGIAVLSAMNAHLATRIARGTRIKSPTLRCASTLERLVGRQDLPCELPVTQFQVADICGLSRGAVATALASLERDGKIARGYGSISVLKRLIG